MHQGTLDFDINLKEISKIEGSASLEIMIRDGSIKDLKFSISEWKRFYTQAIRKKPVTAVPQLVARICGTCSNAHLLCCIKAVERTLDIVPSEQTILLRKLLNFGLIIRDHALHLYLFALPDVFKKNSILEFDENDPVQHECLHDAFFVKEVGNRISIAVGGRSVHAPQPTIGGFLKLPTLDELKKILPDLVSCRERIMRLLQIFANSKTTCHIKNRKLIFIALDSPDFSFLDGDLKTSDNRTVSGLELGNYLDAEVIPYSQARGFTFDGDMMMVGAVSRINLAKDRLHLKTRLLANEHLSRFPSENIYDNNIAQAIEILHAIDAYENLVTSLTEIKPETPQKIIPKAGLGVGAIEAPRGTLYYKLETANDGTVIKGDIIVPSGLNQILMEQSVYQVVSDLLPSIPDEETIINKVEEMIRAFDPCMSCASHFIKLKWT